MTEIGGPARTTALADLASDATQLTQYFVGAALDAPGQNDGFLNWLVH